MRIFNVPIDHELKVAENDIGMGEWRKSQRGLLETTGASTCIVVAAYSKPNSMGYMGHFTDLSGEQSAFAEDNRRAYEEMLAAIKAGEPLYRVEFWLGGGGIHFHDGDHLSVGNDRDLALQHINELGFPGRNIHVNWLEDGESDVTVKLNSANGVIMVQNKPRHSF